MTTEETKQTEEKKMEEPAIKEDEKETTGKRPVTKEKLRSIMEAASALTALGDEDEDEDGDDESEKEGSSLELGSKRYIPEHKKPDAALTFPEKVCFISIVRILCRS